jgi:choline monooxygenase
MTNPRLHEILASYDATAPLAEASTIPAAWYSDSRLAELERRAVFGHTWQVVGRVDQLSDPGRYFTADVGGEPLAAVRGGDGVLRAFYNVCRHHAAAILTKPEGRESVLRCPYHGWTYTLEGALKGVPEFDRVCKFDRTRNGLIPVRVDSWEKFVFVNLDSGAGPLQTFLGGLRDRVGPLDLSKLTFLERRTYTLNCNWKVYVDNYLDGGYHVPHLHKSLNSVLEYADYTVETQDRYCLQSSPIHNAGADAGTAAVRQGRAYYFWQYPNFMINCYEGVMDTNLVLPLDVDRCQVIFDFYFQDVSESRQSRNCHSIEVSERIQNEDVAICESVQRGLRSNAYTAGRLSVRREAGEHLFHRLLSADLRAGLKQHRG